MLIKLLLTATTTPLPLNQDSVTMMMSGLVLSMRLKKAGFLCTRDWQFTFIMHRGRKHLAGYGLGLMRNEACVQLHNSCEPRSQRGIIHTWRLTRFSAMEVKQNRTVIWTVTQVTDSSNAYCQVVHKQYHEHFDIVCGTMIHMIRT